ncbi:TraK family protein [Marinobacter shengliensis]|uniref:TraK family protein n=1 Tax=Marinobacter shengliensis TaxID=1389223 RepID=UPI002573C229|nr:TraK family protein [Marinobacter shengliensis]BEH16708.1 hypothetical protein MAALD49_40760 [Marinobacter shengliensis]
MTTDYMQELAEWASQKKAKQPRQDKHVVAFLAVRDDVKAALDGGYAMKTIWEHMRETGRISSRYETFTLHVKRFITDVKPVAKPIPAPASAGSSKPAATKKAEPSPVVEAPESVPGEPKKVTSSLPTFSFNPVARKEDLL